ncbi:hypothetical protein AVEN_24702-1 [Araneus ventricosus]|uniref:Histone-lysine N-methyltransferase SETMAR n=1 Tax=Araneus ventricosus TaxID=182803 RepID=A0A4Y2NBD5_ARAVE|nr:hypothetical protein AVEN_24702-1 [Araneus ventricosus]
MKYSSTNPPVVAGRPLHGNFRPHAAQRTQLLQRFHWEVFDHPAYGPDLDSKDYHLFQHLKRFLAKQYFPKDDEAVRDGRHRLAPLPTAVFRHQCTKIGVTVLNVLPFRWFLG